MTRLSLKLSLSIGALVLFSTSGCSAHRDSENVLRSNKNARIFETPESALNATRIAFNSEDPDQITDIFGTVGKKALLTGDRTADGVMMRRVSERMERRVELFPVKSAEYVNEQWYKIRFDRQGWNMRVPLVNRGQGWLFAPEYAADELREFRREFNQLVATATSRNLARAQKEYFKIDRDGDGVLEYAQLIISSPGQTDGLYWPEGVGSGASPLDAIVAKAVRDGYGAQDGGTPVYEGYVYRILVAQGPYAPGGARKYLVDGNMTEGFAVLAYPVRWGQTGSKTYLTTSDGRVFARDLGFKTGKICDPMTVMDSDRFWKIVDHPDG